MPLPAGTKLGPYEIEALIGTGGMGEVYRARDARLDRTVAIKVAQNNFGERFEREAHAIAALNHPHICQLYDVGPNYLVMEYVEGKPLAGPMAPADALKLAAQIAEALDAAHKKGIIHRDLKPGNILVSKAGGVKLLDFGLAKLTGRTAAAASESTVTQAITREGFLVGTLQYMSPEQLQGLEADHRSDIFSFGAVLHELLTGKRAFNGANSASIIAAILTSEPPPLATLIPLSPASLDRTLRACLAKDPEARWHSAHDLAQALQWIADGAWPDRVVRDRGPSRIGWMAASVLGLAAVGFGVTLLLKAPPVPPLVRLNAPVISTSFMARPILSPDGSRIAYVSGDTDHSQLWVRSLSTFEAQAVSGATNVSEPIWSPDSKQFAYAYQGKLYRSDLSGQNRQVICDLSAETPEIYGSWAASGFLLFSMNDSIVRVPVAGGETQPVTHPNRAKGEIRHLTPFLLPDERHFVFVAINQRTEESAIYEASLDSPQLQKLIANPVGPVYLSGKYLLFVRGASPSIIAQPFDWKTGRLSGDAITLPEHPYSYSGSFNPLASFSVSDNALAYFPSSVPQTELAWYDRDGKRLGTLGGVAHHTNPAISRDGKRVAVGIDDPRTSQRDIWILDTSGSAMRLTSHPKDDFNPVWSPDRSLIAFTSDRSGSRNLYWKSAAGNGPDELLFASSTQKAADDWSPDGKFVIFNDNTTGEVMAVPFQGEHKPFAAVQCNGSCDQAAISPDGKWIAYRAHDGGHVEVFLQPFPPTGAQWQISVNGGGEPSWRRDGRELFFVENNRFFAVDIKATTAGVEHGAPKPLFSAPLTLELRRSRYVPSADGMKFLAIVNSERQSQEINIVLNWAAALKGR